MRYVWKRMSAVAPGLVPVWMVDYPDYLDNVTTHANRTFSGSSGDQNKYQSLALCSIQLIGWRILLILAPFDDLFIGNDLSDCLPPCSKLYIQTRLLTQQVTSTLRFHENSSNYVLHSWLQFTLWDCSFSFRSWLHEVSLKCCQVPRDEITSLLLTFSPSSKITTTNFIKLTPITFLSEVDSCTSLF